MPPQQAPEPPEKAERDLLPALTRDESDHWGELPPDPAADDDHYLRDRPPHHGD